ncbi:MAG TPA: hypothetical protein VFO03_02270, partial [Gaiellaceae bacterium]|nr:hypothetical protein [Gaiellaceae bacterium]
MGVGVVALWRSRKGGSGLRRYARRAGLAVAMLAGLFFGLLPFSQSYVTTHAARAYVPSPQLGAPFEEVSFRAGERR